jgi:hypothetical protein
LSGAIIICGAVSRTPGRNTNMNPPLRASRQSTARILVTRAVTTRPRMSNRIVSPTAIAERSRMPSSIDTSASVEGPVQNSPSTIRSFDSR